MTYLGEMLHGQVKRADTSSDRPGRQMNRTLQCQTWETKKEMLRGQRNRADTTSDRPGTNMASGKGRTLLAVTDLGDKRSGKEGRTPAATDLGDK